MVQAQPAPTFSTGVKVVNLFATVRDQQGRFIRNLNKEDFRLEEDGRPQTIRYFAQESELPLTLGLLVDTSLSQGQVLGQERIASLAFLGQVLRPDRDRAFVIHFDREVELLQDLTASRAKLEAALAQLALPREERGAARARRGPDVGRWALGGTELYDAVLLASEELMRKQSGRKALVVLTDGVDNGSKVGLMRAIEAAQRADTLVYAILFSDWNVPRGRRPVLTPGVDGRKVLQLMTEATGGALFEVSAQQPIESLYSQLEGELRNQYSVGYTPDQEAERPGYRKIRLYTTNTALEVKTRDGYFSGR